ncbi:tRNA (guanine-N(7)-)-methyltransferase [Acrasis kona]|uniref:tRNA (Guanine-N(7)-)-methyltransferase n=1 Tax=Acrasis kona TaxID=1008807 RepID=A0AAW2YY64_9EUKA
MKSIILFLLLCLCLSAFGDVKLNHEVKKKVKENLDSIDGTIRVVFRGRRVYKDAVELISHTCKDLKRSSLYRGDAVYYRKLSKKMLNRSHRVAKKLRHLKRKHKNHKIIKKLTKRMKRFKTKAQIYKKKASHASQISDKILKKSKKRTIHSMRLANLLLTEAKKARFYAQQTMIRSKFYRSESINKVKEMGHVKDEKLKADLKYAAGKFKKLAHASEVESHKTLVVAKKFEQKSIEIGTQVKKGEALCRK